MDKINDLIIQQQEALRDHKESKGDTRRKAWEKYKKITAELYKLRHGKNPGE